VTIGSVPSIVSALGATGAEGLAGAAGAGRRGLGAGAAARRTIGLGARTLICGNAIVSCALTSMPQASGSVAAINADAMRLVMTFS
jgi:hypothetical protein